MDCLTKLSGTLIPIALVSVGARLELNPARLRARAGALGWGLALKLFVFPLCVAWGYRFFLDPGQMTYPVVVLEAGMAPMITAGILAAESGLDEELASLMVGVGIPLSLLTVPLLSWVFGFWVPR